MQNQHKGFTYGFKENGCSPSFSYFYLPLSWALPTTVEVVSKELHLPRSHGGESRRFQLLLMFQPLSDLGGGRKPSHVGDSENKPR